MKINNFSICISDQMYGRRLADYLKKRKNLFSCIHMFSSPEKLIAFVEETKTDIVLLGEEWEEKFPLIPENIFTVLLSEQPTGKHKGGAVCIYKFQCADHLLGKILKSYAEWREDSQILYETGESGKVISVYSPCQTCEKELFSLYLAKELAKKGPLLYLNLDLYPVLLQTFYSESETDITDILYGVEQGSKNLDVVIKAMIREWEYFSYLPTARYPQELSVISVEYWIQCLNLIFSSGGFDIILLDAGSHLPLQVLEVSAELYIPLGNGMLDEMRKEKFEQLMRYTGTEYMLEHTVYIPLPDGMFEYSGVLEPSGAEEKFLQQLLRQEQDNAEP